MPKQLYTASEAAAALGISLDTLRRWDKAGRDHGRSETRATGASSRRAEIDRLRGDGAGTHLSARNRFNAVVTDVKVEGLMAQVEMVVTDPVRLRRRRHPRRRRGARPQERHGRDRDRQVHQRDGSALVKGVRSVP